MIIESPETNPSTFDSCTTVIGAGTRVIGSLLEFKSDWAKIEADTPGTIIRKPESGYDASVFDDVEFTLTSVMVGQYHSYKFREGKIP